MDEPELPEINGGVRELVSADVLNVDAFRIRRPQIALACEAFNERPASQLLYTALEIAIVVDEE